MSRGVAWVLLVVVAIVVGGAAAIAAAAADTERVGSLWTEATFVPDGSAEVVEVIDYDFGTQSRRGIFREVPDLDPAAPIAVSSPDAPDQFVIEPRGAGTWIRIGDPDVTITNRHRYRIAYPLDTLVMDGQVSWNGVGTDWEVPIGRAEVHVVAPFALEGPQCFQGSFGSDDRCEVTTVEPGWLEVVVHGLDAYEGVTIQADIGPLLDGAPAGPAEPTGDADDPGLGWLGAGLLASGLTLIPAAVVWPVLRRQGREQVWSGGPAEAAFGPPGGVGPVELLDPDELDALATIEFAAPRDLSAAAGGIIHDEAVLDRHKVAWLIEAAIRNEVVLDDTDDTVVLRRGPSPPHPAAAAELDRIFGGRTDVTLGAYDKDFASAWSELGQRLDQWRLASGLWDTRGRSRHRWALVVGWLTLLLGLGGVVLGAAMASRYGGPWRLALVATALMAGTGIALVTGGHELKVRTPAGSGRYLQVESFRRFIAGSEAHHAEAAARMGLLRQYTAWAVALDELDHWNEVVRAAAAEPGSAVSAGDLDGIGFVAVAPALSSAVSRASTAPSSSSSGGGGGFSGGGGGGGGGGSW